MSGRKLHEQGIALFRKEDYQAALEKFTQALSETVDDRHTAEIYNDIGVVHKQLEDYEAAHQALDEAWTRFTELADEKGQAQTLGNRAAVYEAEDLLDEAIDAYKKSAAMLEKVGESEMAMYVWQAVSRLRMKQKQYMAAIGAYEEGIENMPKGSLKKKILQKILKMPGSIIGGLGQSSEPEQDS